jgi:hypothetical protein
VFGGKRHLDDFKALFGQLHAVELCFVIAG